MGSKNEMVSTIGPRWTGEGYGVQQADVVRIDPISLEASPKPTFAQKAIEPETTVKKKRLEGAIVLSPIDDYFARFGIEVD